MVSLLNRKHPERPFGLEEKQDKFFEDSLKVDDLEWGGGLVKKYGRWRTYHQTSQL